MVNVQTNKKRKTRQPSAPEWVDMSAKDTEKVIVKLREQDKSSSEIGIILRDKYGIPNAKLVTGKKITQTLDENKMASKMPEDVQNLIQKAVGLKKYLDQNPKDLHNKRALQITESKIRRLVKYYKGERVLPEDWIYDLQTAEMLISR
ncbi:MAG: 30S ribosomal protein S15 [Methanosarcinales archaeon Met12]|nr:MAG: 30S ribosomal protein S15 [Methanosarcinales archaeon Met12]